MKQAIAFVVLSLALMFAPKSEAQVRKHALAKVLLTPVVMAQKAPTGFAKIGATVLFAVETGVDGAHLAFFSADKAFDFLSLQGKIPVLDLIYSGVSVADKDTGRLDVGLENLESSLWGYHN